MPSPDTTARLDRRNALAAYYVEENLDRLCPTCGEGRMFDVIGPDCVALGVSYHNEADAEEMAIALNAAFEAGRNAR